MTGQIELPCRKRLARTIVNVAGMRAAKLVCIKNAAGEFAHNSRKLASGRKKLLSLRSGPANLKPPAKKKSRRSDIGPAWRNSSSKPLCEVVCSQNACTTCDQTTTCKNVTTRSSSGAEALADESVLTCFAIKSLHQRKLPRFSTRS